MMSPLRTAALQGGLDRINVALEGGEDVDAADGNGFTALMLAAKYGHAAAASLLLARGAKVNKRNEHNGSPLRYAAR